MDAFPRIPTFGWSSVIWHGSTPQIVCLCGSTRFWRLFQSESLRLTLGGAIVLTVGAATASDEDHGITPEQKVALDELHKRKIDLADRVHVLNLRGYVGESTLSEIQYAQRLGKTVTWLEPGHEQSYVA